MSFETLQKSLELFSILIRQDADRFDEQKQIQFYGGEPLANRDCLCKGLELIRWFIDRGRLPQATKLSMVTNGTLLNEETARMLKEHDVQVSISLDGGTELLNMNRVHGNGSGAFRSIMNGISNARKVGLRFGLSITISDESLDRAEELLSSLEKLDIKQISFNPILPSVGHTLRHDYAERVAQFLLRADARLGPQGFVEDRLRRKRDALAHARPYVADCAAVGRQQLAVAPNGALGVCHALLGDATEFMGHVEFGPHQPEIEKLGEKWKEMMPIHRTECVSCFALGICGGGCPIRAWRDDGNMKSIDKQFCTHTKATMDYLLWGLAEELR